mgnify:CR=1 FL=1
MNYFKLPASQRIAVETLIEVLKDNEDLLIDADQTVYNLALELKRKSIKNRRSFKWYG